MRYMALEEAFSIRGLDDRQPSPWLGLPLGQRHRAAWARKLPDFTEYRMPEMDAAGIDVQVLSLTVPGLQGHYVDEPRYDEVWAALEELSVPLYLHPGAPPADRWKVLDGRPELLPHAGPQGPAAADALGLPRVRCGDHHQRGLLPGRAHRRRTGDRRRRRPVLRRLPVRVQPRGRDRPPADHARDTGRHKIDHRNRGSRDGPPAATTSRSTCSRTTRSCTTPGTTSWPTICATSASAARPTGASPPAGSSRLGMSPARWPTRAAALTHAA